jgi:hypothetical protein
MAAASHNRATWKVRAVRNSACANKVIAPVFCASVATATYHFHFWYLRQALVARITVSSAFY